MECEFIQAFIRGLTYNGERCLFVRKTTGVRPVRMIRNDRDLIREMFHIFMEGGRIPSSIGFDDSETVLSFGNSYSETCSSGKSFVEIEKPSFSRNDTVRGKTVLVTGGAQGFGEGIVRSLAGKGAFVFIADMNRDGAERLSTEINRECGTLSTKPVYVNVTDENSVEEMFRYVESETGGLDVLISNAGVLRAGSVREMALGDFEFVTDVDYKGFFLCTKHASRLMAAQNEASPDILTDIIAISSKSGLEGSNRNGAYAGAKFGVIGLTQSFALELVECGIKVNALCPGNFLDGPLWSDPENGLFVQYLRTGKVPGAESVEDVRRFYERKVPLRRGCSVEDVVKALLYIVEQKYETGQAVPVTGGQVMLN